MKLQSLFGTLKQTMIFSILFLMSLCSSAKTFDCSHKNYSLVEAVDQILTEIFVNQITTVNLLVPERYESFALKDFNDELFSKSFETSKIVFRLDTSGKISTVPGRKKRCNIFVIESFDGFLAIYNKITTSVFRLDGYYLIVLVDGEIEGLGEIFRLLWKIQIYNVIVIYQNDNFNVQLKTFMPFNSMKCNDTEPILHNEFHHGRFVNGVENVYPNKMRNLHRCKVRVAVCNETQPYVFVKPLANHTNSFKGRDISVISALSTRLNFNIVYTFIGLEGTFYSNESSTGPWKSLQDEESDISMCDWWLTGSRLRVFDASTSYDSASVILLVPPGRSLSAYQKLIFPFSNFFWLTIAACFLIGILVIFIVKQKARNIQNFVFGTSTGDPYMNFYSGFFGGAQKILPRRNFARFLLMVFLLYSLIVRSLYQGSFYKLLQSNNLFGEVQTVNEMVRKDFKFYVPVSVAEIMQGSTLVNKRFARNISNFMSSY